MSSGGRGWGGRGDCHLVLQRRGDHGHGEDLRHLRRNLCKTLYTKVFIDGSCSVDRINWSLVIPINRHRQSDGYQWRLFQCREGICQNEEHIK